MQILLFQGQSILIEDVNRHVEGNYVCTADNGIGEPATASMEVIVEYSPEIAIEKVILFSIYSCLSTKVVSDASSCQILIDFIYFQLFATLFIHVCLHILVLRTKIIFLIFI